MKYPNFFPPQNNEAFKQHIQDQIDKCNLEIIKWDLIKSYFKFRIKDISSRKSRSSTENQELNLIINSWNKLKELENNAKFKLDRWVNQLQSLKLKQSNSSNTLHHSATYRAISPTFS